MLHLYIKSESYRSKQTEISAVYLRFLSAVSVHSILLNLLFALSSTSLSESWLTSAPIFIEVSLKFSADVSPAKSRRIAQRNILGHTRRSQNSTHVPMQAQTYTH